MTKQSSHFFFDFSVLYLSAVLVLAAASACNDPTGAAGKQSPFQTYEGTLLSGRVQGCMDDDPNPPPSCI